jgi:hypothetical protein
MLHVVLVAEVAEVAEFDRLMAEIEVEDECKNRGEIVQTPALIDDSGESDDGEYVRNPTSWYYPSTCTIAVSSGFTNQQSKA